MPNWVTCIVRGPVEALRTLVGGPDNEGNPAVDFNKVLSWKGNDPPGRGIYFSSESAVVDLINSGFEGPLEEAPLGKLSDEEWEQVAYMWKNYHTYGFLHSMHFARAAWGCKWNASTKLVDLEGDDPRLKFKTPWSAPFPVVIELSRLHPEAEIEIQYADEDVGNNCGTVKFRAGAITSKDVESGDPSEVERWLKFACNLLGHDPSEWLEELEETPLLEG